MKMIVYILFTRCSQSNCRCGKVIKLDISKNPKLVEALRIKAAPTFTIYKSSEMVWRETGEQDKNSLIGLMSEYLD